MGGRVDDRATTEAWEMGQAGAGVEMAERRLSRRPWLLIQTFLPRAS